MRVSLTQAQSVILAAAASEATATKEVTEQDRNLSFSHRKQQQGKHHFIHIP